MAGSIEIVVKGAREVIKAFENVKVKVDPAIGKELRSLAKPVQVDAQSYALGNISNVGSWQRMKIGRKRVMVYVAEYQHSQGGSPRPDFYPIMMHRAMNPALQRHRASIVSGISGVVERIIKGEF